jgi:membrane-associated protease RseP (regulator of RpoE activity)
MPSTCSPRLRSPICFSMPIRSFAQYSLHLFLFFLTFLTTTLAGAEWVTGKSILMGGTQVSVIGAFTWSDIQSGLWFSVPFLGVLTVHEFGHYFTARHNRVDVTLPYYIPIWLGVVTTIGTLGAFIKIKERIFSRREFFDIGIAGPLAGFVVALPLLFYAFTHLPPPEHIFQIHPEYAQHGMDYPLYVYGEEVPKIGLGRNLLFWFFETYVVEDPALLPHRYEAIHYPLLFAGYLALFFTALNLLPIGQLDGGHILYGMIGYRNFNLLAPLFFVGFIVYAGLGTISYLATLDEGFWFIIGYFVFLLILFNKITPTRQQTLLVVLGVMALQYSLELAFPGIDGYNGWLVFGLILSRVMGVFHPSCPDERPLSPGRMVLGAVAILVFILCFTPRPFVIE